ncbi:MAG TPA: M48 family metalloprotease [Desulfurivibrionaceae bacterium]|nr:M48 family metalloprotease [Desulfurivibrionaceae bacterium]
MNSGKMIVALLLPLALHGCDAGGEFDLGKAITIGVGVLQATTLDENRVRQTAALAARELDGKSRVAMGDSPYVLRLAKITKGLEGYEGLNLNFKVYLAKEVNAFAMADGTVRVHSGLLDAMPDDQVLAVIGHEIAHVGLKHSYQQMREALLTDVAFKAVGSLGETVGELTASQLGRLGQVAVNARFSQSDELEADAWSVKLLKGQGQDPYAMQRAIETLRDKFGSGGGFLSSHPANDKRIANIQTAIEQS